MTGDPPYARPGNDRVGPPGRPGAVPAPEPPDGTTHADDAGTRPADRDGTSGGLPPQHTIERTRTGALWVAAISALVVILLLLIFILQNDEQVQVALFGADPTLPLGVALLLAAVLGALVVALVGTARVVQLRLVAKRHRTEDRSKRR